MLPRTRRHAKPIAPSLPFFSSPSSSDSDQNLAPFAPRPHTPANTPPPRPRPRPPPRPPPRATAPVRATPTTLAPAFAPPVSAVVLAARHRALSPTAYDRRRVQKTESARRCRVRRASTKDTLRTTATAQLAHLADLEALAVQLRAAVTTERRRRGRPDDASATAPHLCPAAGAVVPRSAARAALAYTGATAGADLSARELASSSASSSAWSSAASASEPDSGAPVSQDRNAPSSLASTPISSSPPRQKGTPLDARRCTVGAWLWDPQREEEQRRRGNFPSLPLRPDAADGHVDGAGVVAGDMFIAPPIVHGLDVHEFLLFGCAGDVAKESVGNGEGRGRLEVNGDDDDSIDEEDTSRSTSVSTDAEVHECMSGPESEPGGEMRRGALLTPSSITVRTAGRTRKWGVSMPAASSATAESTMGGEDAEGIPVLALEEFLDPEFVLLEATCL